MGDFLALSYPLSVDMVLTPGKNGSKGGMALGGDILHFWAPEWTIK